MVQPFDFEALADGSANVYKSGRYIGNIKNAAEMALYCKHENEYTAPEGGFRLCVDCGLKTEIGEGFK